MSIVSSAVAAPTGGRVHTGFYFQVAAMVQFVPECPLCSLGDKEEHVGSPLEKAQNFQGNVGFLTNGGTGFRKKAAGCG